MEEVDEEKPSLEHTSQLKKAMDLIYDALEYNNVPVSVGITACLNISITGLKIMGVPHEKCVEACNLIKNAIRETGTKVIMWDDHEEQG